MSSLKLLFLEILILQNVSAECDSENGPPGTPVCVFISNPPYERAQWATCVTNTYIYLASKGKFSCVEKHAKYCYYQCMLEDHEDESGTVSEDCECNENQTLPINNLPSWCYSPSGDNCSWYSQCLEKKFPCQDMHQTSYAINNGVRFCQLYQDHFKQFSPAGRKWINAVRGCLQVALVPLLRPFREVTCNEIQQKAFNSHIECYVYPNKDVPSFCSLPNHDRFKALFTVGPELYSNCVNKVYREACANIYESAKQLVNVVYISCPIHATDDLIKNIQIIFSKSVEKTKRYRRSPTPTDDYDAGTDLIVTIEKRLRWKLRGVTWIGYFRNNTLDTSNEKINSFRTFHILLAPSKLYNLNYKTNVTLKINMTEILNEVTFSFKNGSFTSNMINGISIEKYNVCGNRNCSEITVEVKPLTSVVTKDQKYTFWTMENEILVVVGSVLFLVIFVLELLNGWNRETKENNARVNQTQCQETGRKKARSHGLYDRTIHRPERMLRQPRLHECKSANTTETNSVASKDMQLFETRHVKKWSLSKTVPGYSYGYRQEKRRITVQDHLTPRPRCISCKLPQNTMGKTNQD
ncbi:uncharacterized protein LOC134240111 [Saccostrea cucullata]|uniref:uncharacterized protein LOC134240111 n=1 Tax=Saccostrea cuccullata TaxID=36930 RepID=UPI002ED41FD5